MRKLLCLLLCLLLSCTEKKTLTSWNGIFFDIPFELHVAGSLSEKEKKSLDIALKEIFQKADLHWNHWNPNSELTELNTLPSGVYPLSSELRTLLKSAIEASKLTGGYFHPGLGEAIQKAKSSLRAGIVPPCSTPHTFEQLCQLREEGFVKQTSFALDCDGIVKGFIVDRIAAMLEQKGYRHFLINWSGEIVARGLHPEGRPWKIRLEPLGTVLEIKDQAIATSGSTSQSWTIEGQNYTHIVHPLTGIPLLAEHHPIAVSVIAPTCTEADAIATAAMCLSKKAFENEIVHLSKEFLPIFFKNKQQPEIPPSKADYLLIPSFKD